MPCILNIETSTNLCSVAVTEDGACIYEETSGGECTNSSQCLPRYVQDAISFADSHAIPLDAVAVSMGPGSYTGLRIGVSEAKGVCFGRDAKLIAVPTLKLLCVPLLLEHELPEGALLCPMIDARRMEVYMAVYDRALNEITPTRAEIVTENTFSDIPHETPIFFFGNGARKCCDTIAHPNAHFVADVVPEARNMMPLSEMAMARGQFVDVAYFEPFYLKEFVAGKKKAADK